MGECRGGCSGLGKEAGNEGWFRKPGRKAYFVPTLSSPLPTP